MTLAEVMALKSGAVDEGVVRKVAGALGLGAEALVALAKGAWRPREVGAVAGLGCFNTPFDEMTVNAYVAFDPATRRAAAFDTGADCDGMVEIGAVGGAGVGGDFVDACAYGSCVRFGQAEGGDGGAGVGERAGDVGGGGGVCGWEDVGGGGIEDRGAADERACAGGTTFVVTGLARRLAVVGDALFAGSMGGGLVDYGEALRTNRAGIFTLEDETVLCPGHGPLTTVGEEKLHNPFFPEFQR